MYSQLRRCHGLDSLELKALSVPSSLRFLLGIEYDVVLCVTEVGSRRPFTLHFPVFAETFRKLLSLCAMRFSLECTHSEDGSSVLSGAAVMPLLRYADYLPGALHVEELLECLQVAPSATPKRREGGSASDFEASFLDYAEFTSEASLNDVHGLGFYLTLDYGLSLASHGHLVDIRFHEDWNPKEAIREFQEFSGWETFDLRFYDDHNKKEGGVIVFPTIQDVCDLLEKYEDEDSDDEGDLLPFILRPVAALIPVPSIEDSVLRKQREQNWSEIVQFWERFPRTKNTVVVYNLFDGATLPDVLAFMEGLPIEKSCLVEDHSPQKRRRAFVTFADASSTKKALELDGRSTKGRTLRVQVSPPYINDERRGTEVKETVKTKVRGGTGKRSTSGAGQGSPTTKPTTSNGGATAGKQSASPGVAGAGAVKAATQQKEKNAKPADGKHSGAKVEDIGANHTGASQSTTSAASIGTTAPTAAPPAIPLPASQAGGSSSVKALEHAWASAALAHGRPSAASAAPTTAMAVGSSPLVVPAPSSATEKHHLQIPAPASAAKAKEGGSTRPTSASASPSLMNAEAKEFVPSFRLNVNSPEFRPELPPPPSYTDPAFLLDADLLPPPAVPPPPPPSYGATAGLAPPPPPHGCFTVAPPRPRSATASAHLTYEDAGGPPPLFTMPPPYNPSAAGLPPPPPPPY